MLCPAKQGEIQTLDGNHTHRYISSQAKIRWDQVELKIVDLYEFQE